MFRHSSMKQSHLAWFCKLLQKAFVALWIISFAVKITDSKTRYILYFPFWSLFGLTVHFPVNVFNQTYSSYKWKSNFSRQQTALQMISTKLVTARHCTKALQHWYRHWQYHTTKLSRHITFVHLMFEGINSKHFGHLCLCSRPSDLPTLLNKPYDGFFTHMLCFRR